MPKKRTTRNDLWNRGFGTALAEIHRKLLSGLCPKEICEVARVAGLTMEMFEVSGLEDYDLDELRRAGVK
jgi:hypothetical protein